MEKKKYYTCNDILVIVGYCKRINRFAPCFKPTIRENFHHCLVLLRVSWADILIKRD